MLNEIGETILDSNGLVAISRCSLISQHVIGQRINYGKQSLRVSPLIFNSYENEPIYYYPGGEDLGGGWEDVLNNLNVLYSEVSKEELYSFDGKTKCWREFSRKENDFVALMSDK
ncbi:hypothetical protein [Dyadobacter sp. 3J3]|uniref:hypothetical protein n=1 Tax=Dyadobacter sp. 3J3 TaxID=2606600 RepID=UPI0013572513|nr:hypothetical protein [Dyadobacter sp. 3J3]